METIPEKIENLLPTLRQIAANFANSAVTADDILQATCEKIIRTCKPEDTRSYICQLATWQAKNMVKAECIYKMYVGRIDDHTSEIDGGDTLDALEITGDPGAEKPESRLIEIETAAEVQALINSLPEYDSQIITLFLAGLSYEAIARSLNTTGNNISQRIRRMRGAFLAANLTPALVAA